MAESGTNPRTIELLAPAKNADFGIEAIIHGADAVYIGGPAFGARAAAGNSIADIERLATFAHRYDARVLVALNTLLRDDELEAARAIAWQSYEAGADALIVQDMGLLELDLPPIELHASTQTNNRTVAKVQFLESIGFSQIVLARELSLDQIRAISDACTAKLEFFIHGALCVCYSGQCNLSNALTGRSANRGDCSQPCRLPYSLEDANGARIAEHRHLLSLKDNNQTDNLKALIDAGISSFKIEGRLKDLAYIKNVTAHYRQQLDRLLEEMPDYRRSSSGSSRFFFTPAPEKSFNRGATDYFVRERHIDVGAFDSPKFVGETIGEVVRVGRKHVDVASTQLLANGDGLTFFNAQGELVGFRINTVEKAGGFDRLAPTLVDGGLPPGLGVGTRLYRNHDQLFERLLEKASAERRIAIRLHFSETAEGFSLRATDERGTSVSVAHASEKQPAQNAERALATIQDSLGKLGNTIYQAAAVEVSLSQPWFLPASALNELRRNTIEALDRARQAAYRRPQRSVPAASDLPYPETVLDYLGNVTNSKARLFYEKHGVTAIEPAFECHQEKGDVSLMITKHCLRFSFNLCPKQVKGIRPDPMKLIGDAQTLTLRFDCKACVMHVVGRLSTQRTIRLASKGSRSDQ